MQSRPTRYRALARLYHATDADFFDFRGFLVFDFPLELLLFASSNVWPLLANRLGTAAAAGSGPAFFVGFANTSKGTSNSTAIKKFLFIVNFISYTILVCPHSKSSP
jgi:hypothetical protein